jgi:MtaA/CmuA family methyltransferase
MAYDGVIEDIKTAIRLEKPKRLPVFACSEEFDVKWYGKYTYEEVCQDGDKMAEVWSAAIKEFDYDWAWLQIDDCFEIEPLGVGCVGKDNILRATKEYLPANKETLENLPKIDPLNDGRMPEKLKATRKIRDEFGDNVLVMGSLAAPYSTVGLVWGMEETMIKGMTDKQLLQDACDFFAEQQYRYAKAQYEAGAHAIWLGDCDAFSGMLGVEQYMEFAFPSCKKLVEKIKKDTDLIIHLHISEISIPHLLAEAKLGVDIINAGPAVDISEVRKSLTGQNCFSGNLDPIEVLMRGTPEQVAKEAERIVKICYTDQGGYVFNTGEMNPRDVPAENMKAMVQAARKAAAGLA